MKTRRRSKSGEMLILATLVLGANAAMAQDLDARKLSARESMTAVVDLRTEVSELRRQASPSKSDRAGGRREFDARFAELEGLLVKLQWAQQAGGSPDQIAEVLRSVTTEISILESLARESGVALSEELRRRAARVVSIDPTVW